MAFLRHSGLEDNVLLQCWVMYVTGRLHVGLSRHRPPDAGGLWEDTDPQGCMEPCETLGQLLELGFSSKSKAQHKPSQQMVHQDSW